MHIPVSDVEGVAPAHVAEAQVVVLASAGSCLDGERAGVEVAQVGDCLFYCFYTFLVLFVYVHTVSY